MRIRVRSSIGWYILNHFKLWNLVVFYISCLALLWNFVNLFAKTVNLGLIISIIFFLASVGCLLGSLYIATLPSSGELELKAVSSIFGNPESTQFPLKRLRIGDGENELGFKIIQLGDGYLISQSNDINEWLAKSPHIGVKKCRRHEKIILEKRKEYRTEFIDFLSLKAEHAYRFRNEKKGALCTGLSRQKNTVGIGYTGYFTSVITNEASTYVILKTGEIDSDFRALYPVTGNESDGRLLEIEASDLSNHIGVSLLARTKDGFLWGWRQSKKSEQSIGKRVPGGTGSLDWKDIKKAKGNDLLSIIRYGMARELHEESKIFKIKNITIGNLATEVLVIGYFRWLNRGGKPEFVGLGNAPCDYSELSPLSIEVGEGKTMGEHEGKWPAKTIGDVAAYCDYVLNDNNKRVSLPLKVICHRLRSIITEEFESNEKGKLIELWQLKS